jgi:hypothetical protein
MGAQGGPDEGPGVRGEGVWQDRGDVLVSMLNDLLMVDIFAGKRENHAGKQVCGSSGNSMGQGQAEGSY